MNTATVTGAFICLRCPPSADRFAPPVGLESDARASSGLLLSRKVKVGSGFMRLRSREEKISIDASASLLGVALADVTTVVTWRDAWCSSCTSLPWVWQNPPFT